MLLSPGRAFGERSTTMTTTWSRVRVTGPLASYAQRFAQELLAKGYSDLSVADQLRLMAHASRWMDRHGLGAVVLSDEQLRIYCDDRREQGCTARLSPSGWGCLQSFLRQEGLPAQPPVETPVSACGELLSRYETYLVNERGVVKPVVVRWVKAAELLVTEHPELAAGKSTIGAAEVSAFCSRELPRHGCSSARNLASALRSFLPCYSGPATRRCFRSPAIRSVSAPRSGSSASSTPGTRNSSIILTFIVWFPPAGCLRTIRGGSTRSRISSCRLTYSKQCSGASSWMASKRCMRSTKSPSMEHSPRCRIRRPSPRGFARCSAPTGWFTQNARSGARNTPFVILASTLIVWRFQTIDSSPWPMAWLLFVGAIPPTRTRSG